MLFYFALHAEKITITSCEQHVTGASTYDCSKDVTVRYSDRFLIFADKALYQKNENIVSFPEHFIKPVTIQTPHYLITAESGYFDGKKNEADFHMVEVHTGDEIITAHKAHKDANDTWTFDNAAYIPCSCAKAHWRLSAAHIQVKKDRHCSLRSPRIVLHDDVKVWLPSVSIGLAGAGGRSGFLFPSPRIHRGGNASIYQAYYWNINPHVDTTVGVFARTDQGVLLDQELRCSGEQGGCFAKVYGGRLKHAPDDSITPFWGWADAHVSYASAPYRTLVADLGYGILGKQEVFFHERVPRADEAFGWIRGSSPLYDNARLVGQMGGYHTLRFPSALDESEKWHKEALIDGLMYTSENYHGIGNVFVSNRFETECQLSQKHFFDTKSTTSNDYAFAFHSAYASTFFMTQGIFSGEAGALFGGAIENEGSNMKVRPVVSGHANFTARLVEQDLDNGMFAFETGAVAQSSTPHIKTFQLPEHRYLFVRGVHDMVGEEWFSTSVLEERFSFTKKPSTQAFASSEWQSENWHAYVHVLAELVLPHVEEVEWHCLFKPVKTIRTGLVGRYMSVPQMKKNYAKNSLKTMWHNRVTLGENNISTELSFAQRKYGNGLLYPQSFKVTLNHWYDCWSWSVGYQYARFLEEEATNDWAFFIRLSFGEHADVEGKVSW